MEEAAKHHVCKCGRRMILKRSGGTLIGNDMFHLYQWESFWYICPERRWFNFWRHTEPVRADKHGT